METQTIKLRGLEVTNNNNLPLESVLFAIYNHTQYDGKHDDHSLSASDLMQPIRKTLYKLRYPVTDIRDVSTMMSSAKGTSHHSSMEEALIAYNEEHKDNPYILEKRSQVTVDSETGEWTISGKFDMISPADEKGKRTIKDLKHVSGYAYSKLLEEMENLESLPIEEALQRFPTYTKFQLQLSIYAYLNPAINLNPWGDILFMLSSKVGFGSSPVDFTVRFPLFPKPIIDAFIRRRVTQIATHQIGNTLPLCTDVDRGYKPASYKLLRVNKSGKQATVRGSKFDNYADFAEFVRTKGKPGDEQQITEATYSLCDYCNHKNICDQ